MFFVLESNEGYGHPQIIPPWTYRYVSVNHTVQIPFRDQLDLKDFSPLLGCPHRSQLLTYAHTIWTHIIVVLNVHWLPPSCFVVYVEDQSDFVQGRIQLWLLEGDLYLWILHNNHGIFEKCHLVTSRSNGVNGDQILWSIQENGTIVVEGSCHRKWLELSHNVWGLILLPLFNSFETFLLPVIYSPWFFLRIIK